MDPVWIDLLKAAPVTALALIVWFALRDQAAAAAADRKQQLESLRSIDTRLGRVLERVRTTPGFGVPTERVRRGRTNADSDAPSMPRTVTDEDVNGGG